MNGKNAQVFVGLSDAPDLPSGQEPSLGALISTSVAA